MALLVAALIVVPLVELWLIIQVGGLIGALPTIALLLGCSIGGAWLVRREGRSAWSRFSTTIAEGRIPARETVDGALVVVAGALLLTPGFLTDLCGLLLLARPVRDAIRVFGTARLVGGGWRGLAFTAATKTGARFTDRRASGPPPRQAYDVDGTAVEVDRAELRRSTDLQEKDR